MGGEPRIFVDNDVVLKLAQYGLLGRLTDVFSDSELRVVVLSTARFKLLPNKSRLKLCQSEEAAASIESFLGQADVLSENDVNLDLLERLNDVPGIDSGEALLVAAVMENQRSFLVTGDKRALGALMSDALLEDRSNIASRIITLEGIIRALIDDDLEMTQRAVRGNPSVDKALALVFGVSAPASAEGIYTGLRSYMNHLQSKVGELLAPGPPFDLPSDIDD